VDPTVRDRVDTVRSQISDLGFVGRVSVQILGADDLHVAWSKKNNANEVEIQLEKQVNLPKMPGVDQAILGVISVSELLKLIQDSDRSLDERVFYDNVRGFKGDGNPVNRQIMETLRSADRSLLPVLNNGVTVVAAKYWPKPGDAVAVTGFQIVNGCQTSHCLYLSQEVMGEAINSVYVPIRLVVTSDEDVATRIIKATNSQTAVQENDLIALTKFQRRLEDFYSIDQADVKLRYERRSGQFYDKDVTKTRVVAISDQMRAISAAFLDTPHSAARYPSSLFQEVGESIFRDEHRLLPYVASAFAAYKIDTAFRTRNLDSKFKPARYHILMALKYRILGEHSAPLNSSKVDDQSLKLIAALKGAEQAELLRTTAKCVVDSADGRLPSPDRLKRQQFTQELIAFLLNNPA
jgi:hypothetical protein